jgi:hypothetical protein
VIGEHNTSITGRKQLVAVPNEDQFVWNESWWLRMGHLSFGIVIDGCLELSLMVVWNCRWRLFGMDIGGCLELLLVVRNERWYLELSLVDVWNGRWWLGVNVGVWNWRWWLFEKTLVVVWNCRWWLFGIDVGGCLELALVVAWNCRCWL